MPDAVKPMPAPCDIWAHKKDLRYDESLSPEDPRRVDFAGVRGDYVRAPLLRELGMHVARRKLRDVPRGKCLLFGGHVGCGKSTELRAIAADLHGPQRFHVILLDVLASLDANNLRYSDLLPLQLKSLVEDLQELSIDVPEVFLSRMRDWYQQKIVSREQMRELSAEIAAGAEAKSGLPFIGKLFAKLTTAVRTNASYKTEIRQVIQDSFSELADAFNQLLEFAEGEIARQQQGKSLLFIVDGTDRLRGEEAERFFIHDIHQLRLVRANAVYCAPISILNEQGPIGQQFDGIFRLPMIKLKEKNSDAMLEAAREKLVEFVTKRMPMECFDGRKTVDTLIECSGGHPRDLLRLVNLCLQQLDEGPITAQVAARAIEKLASEYRRVVDETDYPLLAAIDAAGKEHVPNNPATRRLLYDLALLEYNSYWWQSHPAVRTLPGYRAAAQERRQR